MTEVGRAAAHFKERFRYIRVNTLKSLDLSFQADAGIK